MARLVASAATLAAVGGLGAYSSSATASPAPLHTAHAAAVIVTPGAGITTNVSTSGSLAALVPTNSSAISTVANRVNAALAQLPAAAVQGLAGGTASLVADSSDASSDADTAACSSAAQAAGTCFAVGQVSPAGDAADVSLIDTRGYVRSGADGTAAATTSIGSGAVTVLGNTVARFAALTSTATCTAGSCTHSASAGSVSLAGGSVQVSTTGSGLDVTVNGRRLSDDSVSTSAADVSVSGNTVRIATPLSVTSLLGAAGVSPLPVVDAGSSAQLITTVTPDGDGAALELGLGVDLHLVVDVDGLAQGVIDTAGSGDGNLAGVQLGFTVASTAPDAGTPNDPSTSTQNI